MIKMLGPILKTKQSIEDNRKIITSLLSGAGTHKRLNNVNWLRHELSYTEPKTLFYIPNKEQQPYLDYNCMKNIGEAYDYTIENQHSPIDSIEICKIHSILCANTHIQGGLFRKSDKILEIKINGERFKAPDYQLIPTLLNDIVFKSQDPKIPILNRAFELHYDLIALQPFDDFNKRTSRLIMNWYLIQNGYRPIVFNQPTDKQKYINAISERAKGNIKAYNNYMYSCMLRTQNEIIKLLKKSKVL